MSQTIGRHKPSRLPKGDYESKCDYCGTVFYRSQLTRDGAGLLVCEDEGEGKDAVTLNLEIAQNGYRWQRSDHDSPSEAKTVETAPIVDELIGPTGGNP